MAASPSSMLQSTAGLAAVSTSATPTTAGGICVPAVVVVRDSEVLLHSCSMLELLPHFTGWSATPTGGAIGETRPLPQASVRRAPSVELVPVSSSSSYTPESTKRSRSTARSIAAAFFRASFAATSGLCTCLASGSKACSSLECSSFFSVSLRAAHASTSSMFERGLTSSHACSTTSTAVFAASLASALPAPSAAPSSSPAAEASAVTGRSTRQRRLISAGFLLVSMWLKLSKIHVSTSLRETQLEITIAFRCVIDDASTVTCTSGGGSSSSATRPRSWRSAPTSGASEVGSRQWGLTCGLPSRPPETACNACSRSVEKKQ
mmetsp:Transcript_16983/g.38844  ORF Transcript_16983/g.38844 Transcript_16983/m.38844 type:complete len:321 (+) Transcript_16983:551-1513(+)